MKKRFLSHLFLLTTIFVGLTSGNYLGAFKMSKDSKSSGPPPLESKWSGSGGMDSRTAAYSGRAQELRKKYEQPAQQQGRIQQVAPVAEEVVPEKKQSLFGRAKAKAQEKASSVRDRAIGGLTGVRETVARQVAPEEQLKKDIHAGVSNVVARNSGEMVNGVVDALRGIKVFPSVTQGTPPPLTNFRDEFGKDIGTFGKELGDAIVAELIKLNVFAGKDLEITKGGAAALAEQVKLEGTKDKPKGLFGRIKTAVSDVFKSKSDVALVRIQNAISGCQNDLSDDLIQKISALLLTYLRAQYGSTITNIDVSDLVNIPLRSVIYEKTSGFKDFESRKLIDSLKSKGVLK